MKKINLYTFYMLGHRLNRLAQMDTDGIQRITVWLAGWNAKDDVRDLLDRFPGLTVCRKTGEELLRSLDAANKWFAAASPDDLQEDIGITDTALRSCINTAKQFETVLLAEIQTLATYEAAQKGIYSTPDLIERADQVLPKSARVKLSQDIVEEIRQAGRCLAFDNATASGFHMMRATELVLHEYYLVACKPKPKPAGRLANWGAYIDELEKQKDGDVKEVASIIRQVKNQHRNLIMHPDEVLTPDEAFTLFEIAQSAIIAMALKLKAPKKQTVKSKATSA